MIALEWFYDTELLNELAEDTFDVLSDDALIYYEGVPAEEITVICDTGYIMIAPFTEEEMNDSRLLMELDELNGYYHKDDSIETE